MAVKLEKVGITGASGMVGRHVVKHAANLGIKCVTTSRNRPHSLPAHAEWQSWDLCKWLDMDALDSLFGDIDALLHVGAITPRKKITIEDREMFDANVRSCLCLGNWALHKNIPFVYLSSSTVYSDPESPQISENALLAHQGCKIGGFYGFTKLLGEEMLTRLTQDGLRLCVLRPSSIYGTGMLSDQMVSIFLNRALEGEDIVIDAPPGSKINLIHAADVASVMLTVVQKGIVGTFNIAASEAVTILEVAHKVLQVCGKTGSSVKQIENSANPFLRFDLNCSAAKKAFGFKTQINLEKGLELIKDKLFFAN